MKVLRFFLSKEFRVREKVKIEWIWKLVNWNWFGPFWLSTLKKLIYYLLVWPFNGIWTHPEVSARARMSSSYCFDLRLDKFFAQHIDVITRHFSLASLIVVGDAIIFECLWEAMKGVVICFTSYKHLLMD